MRAELFVSTTLPLGIAFCAALAQFNSPPPQGGGEVNHHSEENAISLPRGDAAGRGAREHGVELIALVIEHRQRRAGEHAAARQFDRHRIDEAIVDDDFEMYMRAGGQAGRADKADDLALAHVAADVESAGIGGEVAVGGLVTVGVAGAAIISAVAPPPPPL